MVVPDRNRSPSGWWLATILTRYEQEQEDISNPNRRCRAWEDTVILRAKDRDEAYEKAVDQGRQRESDDYDHIDEKTRRKGKWIYEGLTSLIPIYEELEDGAEIQWEEHLRSAKKLASWVKGKQDLECFDDN